MAYVVGTFEFDHGSVTSITDLEVVDGSRPKWASDIDGCSTTVLAEMHGTTRARVGTGCALIIEQVAHLAWGDARVRKAIGLEEFALALAYRRDIPCGEGLAGLFRDLRAPGTRGVMDVCAGAAEGPDLPVEAAREAVEIGFYHNNGIGILHTQSRKANKAIEIAAAQEWHRLGCNGSFEKIPAELDTDDPLYATEVSNGSVEVIYKMHVFLPKVSGGWLMRDTEHRKSGGRFVALNRRPLLVIGARYAPRGDISAEYSTQGAAVDVNVYLHAKETHDLAGDCDTPVMLGFGPDGLDPHSRVMYLEGKNLMASTNTKARAALSALGLLNSLYPHPHR